MNKHVAALSVLIGFSVWASIAAEPPQVPSSTWPQAYSIKRDDAAGSLTLSTPYYTVQHDLKRGGAIFSIRLKHGVLTNLLVQPFETRVEDAAGKVYSDLAESAPQVTIRNDGSNEVVSTESDLRDAQGKQCGVRVKTRYEYRWGYVKVRKELIFSDKGFKASSISPVSVVVAPSLSAYGYHDGLTEDEGAPAFPFGSYHWGNVSAASPLAFETAPVPRSVMFVNPGVEGLEWFVSSDLAQWDLQVDGKRGQGKNVVRASTNLKGIALSISPFQNTQSPISVSAPLTFDYYLGVPLLEGHALKPWFHTTFNRNQGGWVSPEQIQRWVADGIQTVHCHNDGDYYGDGLFWRDGSYPPYPDMDKFNKVITDCQKAGVRVATYFSDKELHPSTPEFQQHGTEWGRMNRKGDLQHNAFNDKAEFGAQMCLRSGWLDYLKLSIDRVLTNSPLDGVYYDWNAALQCYNPKHEKLQPGQPAAGHWDVDELIDLMEWTRRRVGPHGLVIIHNTTTPIFAAENFADYVACNEWGYGTWSGNGPELHENPLEWSLAGARQRGIISYTQVDAKASPHLHRLFALEALLSGGAPWPAGSETFELYPILKPIGDIEGCRFADWRNQAVTVQDTRSGSAVYSRPGESWLVVGNLEGTAREIRCTLHPDKLLYPLSAITTASVLPSGSTNASVATISLDPKQLISGGVTVKVGPESAVLIHVK